MFVKDFDRWHIQKKDIDLQTDPDFFVNAGEVWFVQLGCNIGVEENGRGDNFLRPVLVVRKLGATFFVVPLTTKGKDNHRFYYTLRTTLDGKVSRCLLNHAKTMDKKRFFSKLGKVEAKEFHHIKKLLARMYLGEE